MNFLQRYKKNLIIANFQRSFFQKNTCLFLSPHVSQPTMHCVEQLHSCTAVSITLPVRGQVYIIRNQLCTLSLNYTLRVGYKTSATGQLCKLITLRWNSWNSGTAISITLPVRGWVYIRILLFQLFQLFHLFTFFLPNFQQYSKKSSNLAVDLVKRYRSIHILLTALAIIRIQISFGNSF